MYTGELLPANQSEAWFFRKSNDLKELYVHTVRQLEKELLRIQDYKSRLLLYSRAAAIYPFDNWQVSMIRCNLEMYRYDEALDIYNTTMELYAREMGSPPSAEMQKCFENLELADENHRRDTSDPDSWRNMDKVFMGRRHDIQKAIFDGDKKQGAYYCTYPSFVDYCRLVVRAGKRDPFDASLMFVTLSRREGKDCAKSIDLQEQMQLLKTAIGDSLRTGDAYTRYGNRHFILMLTKADKEACSAVFRRVESAYAKRLGKGELWYLADMTQELRAGIR